VSAGAEIDVKTGEMTEEIVAERSYGAAGHRRERMIGGPVSAFVRD
jgi:hypothetical protein